jgi:geranylgeranyl pyrophosphate synthase
MTQTEFLGYLAARKKVVDAAIAALLPAEASEPRAVHRAMRHAALSGGKRLRPIVALAVADLAGRPAKFVLDAACAIELVHAASLVLDDLPSMDDATERRGKPCTHVLFGEATALLSVMGLMSMAFDLVSGNARRCPPGTLLGDPVSSLARAIGTDGLTGGQHSDLNLSGRSASLTDVEVIHQQKAGALFLACVQIPAYLCGIAQERVGALETYARCVGLAFQITDDLLDARIAGEDEGKNTFVTLLGEDAATQRVLGLVEQGCEALDVFEDNGARLRQLAEHVSRRVH